MSVLDRIFGAARSVVELRSDVDRCMNELHENAEQLFDHEKRLIRIETMIEMGGRRPPPRRLPRA